MCVYARARFDVAPHRRRHLRGGTSVWHNQSCGFHAFLTPVRAVRTIRYKKIANSRLCITHTRTHPRKQHTHRVKVSKTHQQPQPNKNRYSINAKWFDLASGIKRLHRRAASTTYLTVCVCESVLECVAFVLRSIGRLYRVGRPECRMCAKRACAVCCIRSLRHQ